MFRALRNPPVRLAPSLFGIACALMPFAPALRAEQEASEEQEAAGRRLQIMQEAIDGFVVTSKEIGEKPALSFARAPLLRYSDQTRDLVDAGVWRLGESGRPTALVTMEIYDLGEGRGLLTYEFLSLCESRFAMTSTRARWEAIGTDLQMADLQDAPKPAESERGRLQQMRQQARRFTASEALNRTRVQLRLMPQPVDRYRDPEANIVDGAVFLFSNGTNPEMAVLLETDGAKWRYGCARLASAAVQLALDDETVAEMPPFRNYGVARKYTATRYRIALPK